MFTVRPNQAAVEFLKAKAAISPANFGRLPQDIRVRAFTTAAAEDIYTVRKVLDALRDIPAGKDWAEARRGVAAALGGGEGADADTRKAMRRRADLIVHMAGRQAYAAGKYAEMMDQADVFPYWRYIADGDERTRPEHKALDGSVFPADDPFWDTHYPPWEFGCRCTVVVMTEEEAKEARLPDGKSDGYPDGKPGGIPAMSKGERFPNSASGYRFNPRDLNRDPDEMMESYGDDWPDFVDAMKAMPVDAPDGMGGRGVTNAMDIYWRQFEAKDDRVLLDHMEKHKTEMVIVRDGETGAVIFKNAGDYGSVSYDDVFDKAREQGNTVRSTHVHPEKDSTPSPSDIIAALHEASDRARIVSEGGRSVFFFDDRMRTEAMRIKAKAWEKLIDISTGDERRDIVKKWRAWLRNQNNNGMIEYWLEGDK